MHHIIEYIKQKYDPCSIILYGSYADGTNNLNSDFDALVLSYNYEQFHDTSFVNGVQLDLFVYPVSYFDEAYERGMKLQQLELSKLDVNMFAAIDNSLINDGCGLYRGRLILPYEHLSRFQND